MNIFLCTENQGKIREFEHFLTAIPNVAVRGIRALAAPERPPYAPPREDLDVFLGNALLKLLASLDFVRNHGHIDLVLVDDSGLCVPALGFEPGVHSAYYGGTPRSDARNREALRKTLAGLAGGTPPEFRQPAFFVSVLLVAEVSPSLRTAKLGREQLRLADITAAERRWFSKIAADLPGATASGSVETLSLPLAEFISGAPADARLHAFIGSCFGEVSTVEQTLLEGEGHGYDCMFYGNQHPDLSFASIPLERKNQESHRGWALSGLKKALDEGIPQCKI